MGWHFCSRSFYRGVRHIRWVKHDTDANQDAKLQNVLLDYGLEGYGLYWYCIELIAHKIDNDNITFELEHDARIIARNTGSTSQKVEEMMRYFVNAGLFEDSTGAITCMKLAKRLDKSMTSNPQMREIIGKLKNHDGVMTQSAKPMQDNITLDNITLDKKDTIVDSTNQQPNQVKQVLDHLNQITGSKYKPETKSHAANINARLKDHSVDELKAVIDFKFKEWGGDPKMAAYIRPSTLFQAGKFDGYLLASKTVKQGGLNIDTSKNIYESGAL